MWVHEHEFSASVGSSHWVGSVLEGASRTLGDDQVLLRAVVNSIGDRELFGEALVLSGIGPQSAPVGQDAFRLAVRQFENTSSFTAAFVIPTGVGAEVGGHAGDAAPVVRLLASLCDQVITHPNAVNASDINESPANALYVEGSVLTRLILGNISLQPVRNNRVLVVIDDHPDQLFVNAAVNAVNAARATYGLDVPQVMKIQPGVRLKVAYSASGRAIGEVTSLDFLVRRLMDLRSEYDAVALSSVINVPAGYHQGYFDSKGEMVNPWGGVEAMLTHALSTLLNVPTAHAPMFETREIANADPGIVDPRMSAEAVSLTFLQCVLKGLQRSPRIIPNAELGREGLIDVTRISCLVTPDGCVGVPTLAALAQGIPVVAVRENRSLMHNDLRSLPWKNGQLHLVENYWEAAGVLSALKAGIDPGSVRRPLPYVEVSRASQDSFIHPAGQHAERVHFES